MSLKVVLTRPAEYDLIDASDCYQERAGGGFKFASRVPEALERLGEMPEIYPFVHAEVRRGRVHGYPYVFYYRVKADCVEVLAIVHGRRSPDAWKGRL
ncbi:type II toxin-antitoxin system RelE/ParE family toxin [Paludisphaera sp.]|uniref:type II toxin-antitoxin system RelE/ParE family toxin n=1 Tax=Paludisphaera sp. TaxID=2017432 RepID=UPI00301CEF4C